mmetsp:Transcript_8203/g.33645  ORF Transcript_8203/g.33645 Transcript_8203/m.33645 type:complete len:241 (-) Transcript_8203:20-742(-)
MHGPRAPASRCRAARISLSSPWFALSLALHQPTTFMPFFAAACSPSSSRWSSSSLTDSSLSQLLRCFSGRAPVLASASFPLFFPFPPTPCSGSRRSVVPSPAAARSTAGGSMGTAVTASDVSSGRSLTDSVASNEPAIVAATMRNNEKSRANLCEPVSSGSARGHRGFSPNRIWWGWLLAHGGVPSSRCAADARSSREPDGTRGYRPKPTHGPAPTGARPSRRLPRRFQARSSSPGWSLR